MRPADALRLPRARLTDEQRKTVAKAIEMMESLFEKGMTRSGLSVDMQCNDLVVVNELERNYKRDGWLTSVVPDWEPPRIRGGAPTLKGFKMILAPPPAAYDEADEEIQS
jgi:hypothetical protein